MPRFPHSETGFSVSPQLLALVEGSTEPYGELLGGDGSYYGDYDGSDSESDFTPILRNKSTDLSGTRLQTDFSNVLNDTSREKGGEPSHRSEKPPSPDSGYYYSKIYGRYQVRWTGTAWESILLDRQKKTPFQKESSPLEPVPEQREVSALQEPQEGFPNLDTRVRWRGGFLGRWRDGFLSKKPQEFIIHGDSSASGDGDSFSNQSSPRPSGSGEESKSQGPAVGGGESPSSHRGDGGRSSPGEEDFMTGVETLEDSPSPPAPAPPKGMEPVCFYGESSEEDILISDFTSPSPGGRIDDYHCVSPAPGNMVSVSSTINVAGKDSSQRKAAGRWEKFQEAVHDPRSVSSPGESSSPGPGSTTQEHSLFIFDSPTTVRDTISAFFREAAMPALRQLITSLMVLFVTMSVSLPVGLVGAKIFLLSAVVPASLRWARDVLAFILTCLGQVVGAVMYQLLSKFAKYHGQERVFRTVCGKLRMLRNQLAQGIRGFPQFWTVKWPLWRRSFIQSWRFGRDTAVELSGLVRGVWRVFWTDRRAIFVGAVISFFLLGIMVWGMFCVEVRRIQVGCRQQFVQGISGACGAVGRLKRVIRDGLCRWVGFKFWICKTVVRTIPRLSFYAIKHFSTSLLVLITAILRFFIHEICSIIERRTLPRLPPLYYPDGDLNRFDFRRRIQIWRQRKIHWITTGLDRIRRWGRQPATAEPTTAANHPAEHPTTTTGPADPDPLYEDWFRRSLRRRWCRAKRASTRLPECPIDLLQRISKKNQRKKRRREARLREANLRLARLLPSLGETEVYRTRWIFRSSGLGVSVPVSWKWQHTADIPPESRKHIRWSQLPARHRRQGSTIRWERQISRILKGSPPRHPPDQKRKQAWEAPPPEWSWRAAWTILLTALAAVWIGIDFFLSYEVCRVGLAQCCTRQLSDPTMLLGGIAHAVGCAGVLAICEYLYAVSELDLSPGTVVHRLHLWWRNGAVHQHRDLMFEQQSVASRMLEYLATVWRLQTAQEIDDFFIRGRRRRHCDLPPWEQSRREFDYITLCPEFMQAGRDRSWTRGAETVAIQEENDPGSVEHVPDESSSCSLESDSARLCRLSREFRPPPAYFAEPLLEVVDEISPPAFTEIIWMDERILEGCLGDDGAEEDDAPDWIADGELPTPSPSRRQRAFTDEVSTGIWDEWEMSVWDELFPPTPEGGRSEPPCQYLAADYPGWGKLEAEIAREEQSKEKIDALEATVHVLDDAFARAKKQREEVKRLYEWRRKQVRDQIADLRTNIDENISRDSQGSLSPIHLPDSEEETPSNRGARASRLVRENSVLGIPHTSLLSPLRGDQASPTIWEHDHDRTRDEFDRSLRAAGKAAAQGDAFLGRAESHQTGWQTLVSGLGPAGRWSDDTDFNREDYVPEAPIGYYEKRIYVNQRGGRFGEAHAASQTLTPGQDSEHSCPEPSNLATASGGTYGPDVEDSRRSWRDGCWPTQIFFSEGGHQADAPSFPSSSEPTSPRSPDSGTPDRPDTPIWSSRENSPVHSSGEPSEYDGNFDQGGVIWSDDSEDNPSPDRGSVIWSTDSENSDDEGDLDDDDGCSVDGEEGHQPIFMTAQNLAVSDEPQGQSSFFSASCQGAGEEFGLVFDSEPEGDATPAVPGSIFAVGIPPGMEYEEEDLPEATDLDVPSPPAFRYAGTRSGAPLGPTRELVPAGLEQGTMEQDEEPTRRNQPDIDPSASAVYNWRAMLRTEARAERYNQGHRRGERLHLEVYELEKRVRIRVDTYRKLTYQGRLGDEIVIQENEEEDSRRWFGYYDDVQKDFVMTRTKDNVMPPTGKRYVFGRIFSMVPFRRISEAISSVETSVLAKPLMSGGLHNPALADRPLVDVQADEIQLDSSQQVVCERASRLPEGGIGWIWGPPGTGKTTTATTVMMRYVGSDKRILVVSGTNVAVDDLARAAVRRKVLTLRVRSFANSAQRSRGSTIPGAELDDWLEMWRKQKSVPSEVQQLDRLVSGLRAGQPLQREVDKLRGRLLKTAMAQAQVVATTTSTAATVGGAWDLCIVDEAAHSTELDLLVPLVKCRRTILLGDFQQTEPVYTHPGLRTTLLEKVVNQQPDHGAMLTTQYRMHPDISAFPAKTFYDGGLIDSEFVRQRAGRASPTSCAVLHDGPSERPEGRSWQNETELRLTADTVTTLLASGYEQSQIAILTAYRGQLRITEPALACYPEIDILTWDAAIGKEYDVTIINLSCGVKPSGFVANRKRVNVALTRAKQLQIVIAPASAANSRLWAKYFEHVKAKTINLFPEAGEGPDPSGNQDPDNIKSNKNFPVGDGTPGAPAVMQSVLQAAGVVLLSAAPKFQTAAATNDRPLSPILEEENSFPGQFQAGPDQGKRSISPPPGYDEGTPDTPAEEEEDLHPDDPGGLGRPVPDHPIKGPQPGLITRPETDFVPLSTPSYSRRGREISPPLQPIRGSDLQPSFLTKARQMGLDTSARAPPPEVVLRRSIEGEETGIGSGEPAAIAKSAGGTPARKDLAGSLATDSGPRRPPPAPISESVRAPPPERPVVKNSGLVRPTAERAGSKALFYDDDLFQEAPRTTGVGDISGSTPGGASSSVRASAGPPKQPPSLNRLVRKKKRVSWEQQHTNILTPSQPPVPIDANGEDQVTANIVDPDNPPAMPVAGHQPGNLVEGWRLTVYPSGRRAKLAVEDGEDAVIQESFRTRSDRVQPKTHTLLPALIVKIHMDRSHMSPRDMAYFFRATRFDITEQDIAGIIMHPTEGCGVCWGAEQKRWSFPGPSLRPPGRRIWTADDMIYDFGRVWLEPGDWPACTKADTTGSRICVITNTLGRGWARLTRADKNEILLCIHSVATVHPRTEEVILPLGWEPGMVGEVEDVVRTTLSSELRSVTVLLVISDDGEVERKVCTGPEALDWFRFTRPAAALGDTFSESVERAMETVPELPTEIMVSDTAHKGLGYLTPLIKIVEMPVRTARAQPMVGIYQYALRLFLMRKSKNPGELDRDPRSRIAEAQRHFFFLEGKFRVSLADLTPTVTDFLQAIGEKYGLEQEVIETLCCEQFQQELRSRVNVHFTSVLPEGRNFAVMAKRKGYEVVHGELTGYEGQNCIVSAAGYSRKYSPSDVVTARTTPIDDYNPNYVARYSGPPAVHLSQLGGEWQVWEIGEKDPWRQSGANPGQDVCFDDIHLLMKRPTTDLWRVLPVPGALRSNVVILAVKACAGSAYTLLHAFVGTIEPNSLLERKFNLSGVTRGGIEVAEMWYLGRHTAFENDRREYRFLYSIDRRGVHSLWKSRRSMGSTMDVTRPAIPEPALVAPALLGEEEGSDLAIGLPMFRQATPEHFLETYRVGLSLGDVYPDLPPVRFFMAEGSAAPPIGTTAEPIRPVFAPVSSFRDRAVPIAWAKTALFGNPTQDSGLRPPSQQVDHVHLILQLRAISLGLSYGHQLEHLHLGRLCQQEAGVREVRFDGSRIQVEFRNDRVLDLLGDFHCLFEEGVTDSAAHDLRRCLRMRAPGGPTLTHAVYRPESHFLTLNQFTSMFATLLMGTEDSRYARDGVRIWVDGCLQEGSCGDGIRDDLSNKFEPDLARLDPDARTCTTTSDLTANLVVPSRDVQQTSCANFCRALGDEVSQEVRPQEVRLQTGPGKKFADESFWDKFPAKATGGAGTVRSIIVLADGGARVGPNPERYPEWRHKRHSGCSPDMGEWLRASGYQSRTVGHRHRLYGFVGASTVDSNPQVFDEVTIEIIDETGIRRSLVLKEVYELPEWSHGKTELVMGNIDLRRNGQGWPRPTVAGLPPEQIEEIISRPEIWFENFATLERFAVGTTVHYDDPPSGQPALHAASTPADAGGAARFHATPTPEGEVMLEEWSVRPYEVPLPFEPGTFCFLSCPAPHSFRVLEPGKELPSPVLVQVPLCGKVVVNLQAYGGARKFKNTLPIQAVALREGPSAWADRVTNSIAVRITDEQGLKDMPSEVSGLEVVTIESMAAGTTAAGLQGDEQYRQVREEALMQSLRMKDGSVNLVKIQFWNIAATSVHSSEDQPLKRRVAAQFNVSTTSSISHEYALQAASSRDFRDKHTRLLRRALGASELSRLPIPPQVEATSSWEWKEGIAGEFDTTSFVSQGACSRTTSFAAASQYKRRKDDQQSGTEYESQKAGMAREQDAFKERRCTAPPDSREWAKEVFVRHMDTIDPLSLYDLYGADLNSLRKQCRRMTYFCRALSASYRLAFHGEGHDLPRYNRGDVGLEVVDPTKPMPAQPKPFVLDGLESIRMMYLLDREVLCGLLEDYKPNMRTPLMRFVSTAFAAPRAKTITGRLVVDFRLVNSIMRSVFVPHAHTETVHGHLQQDSIRLYCEGDLAKAFPSLGISPELATYLGVGYSGRTMTSRVVQLGIAWAPGVWSQMTYGHFNNLKVSTKAVDQLMTSIDSAISQELAEFGEVDQEDEYLYQRCLLAHQRRNDPAPVAASAAASSDVLSTPAAEENLFSLEVPPVQSGDSDMVGCGGAGMIARAAGKEISAAPAVLEKSCEPIKPPLPVKTPPGEPPEPPSRETATVPPTVPSSHPIDAGDGPHAFEAGSSIPEDWPSASSLANRPVAQALRQWAETVDPQDPEGDIYQGLLIDDVSYGADGIEILIGRHLRNVAMADSLGLRFSGRKIKFGSRTCSSLGYEFDQGVLQVSEAKVRAVWDLPTIPRSAAELQSLLGLTIYVRSAWGHRYSRIVGPLRKWAYSKNYSDIVHDAEACRCLEELRTMMNTTKLHNLPVDDILRGKRLLFAFVDGCSFGAGYVVASIGSKDWTNAEEGSDLGDAKNSLYQSRDWRIHDVPSVPFSLTMRWLGPREQEVYALRHFARTGFSRLKNLPLTIIGDHANLIDIEEVVHRCSLKAFVGWVLEVAQMFASPRVRAVWAAGESNCFADTASRVLSGSELPRNIAEAALADDVKHLLNQLFPHNPLLSPIKARDVEATEPGPPVLNPAAGKGATRPADEGLTPADKPKADCKAEVVNAPEFSVGFPRGLQPSRTSSAGGAGGTGSGAGFLFCGSGGDRIASTPADGVLVHPLLHESDW